MLLLRCEGRDTGNDVSLVRQPGCRQQLGNVSALPYCRSYHFSETSAEYFCRRVLWFKEIGVFICLKQKKMWFVMLSFVRKAEEHFTRPK